MYFFSTISPAAVSMDELNCGKIFSAAATTFTAIPVMVMVAPPASGCLVNRFRASSSSVMSARSC